MEKLLAEIIEGKEERESAADVLTLCYLAALVVSALETEDAGISDPEEMPLPAERDERFEGVLERLGKILCPLADDVKHRKPQYQDEMTVARLEYSGIAFSDELQRAWRRGIRELAEERQLASVEIAVERDVHRALRIQQGMLGA